MLRRQTIEVKIGNVGVGGANPVRIQSMTNTRTMDTEKTVDQIVRLWQAGCELVRITTPTIAEAENLQNIKSALKNKSCYIPLIADVHFNPKVAELAAQIVEKVRINPGNYVDKKQFKQVKYSDSQYQEEIERIAERLTPLLKICRQNGTAIRIGTNHGSLSDRIVSRYGNSAMGMAVSAMEYVRICHDFGFENLVLSMKSSDVQTMILSVKLLVNMMQTESLHYPLHLGVTEAGNGEYGRIKSAAGMGCLLQNGIGDTLRVSLTEKPENEIPFAQILASLALPLSNSSNCNLSDVSIEQDFTKKRHSSAVGKIGGERKTVILSHAKEIDIEDYHPDELKFQLLTQPSELFHADGITVGTHSSDDSPLIWRDALLKTSTPFIFKRIYNEREKESWIAKAASDVSTLAFQRLIDGIWIENPHFSASDCYQLSLNLLQACGLRYFKAELISCPSCGRTQYDIETCFEEVKSAVIHLKGLKIGVMGCIVNGPGEMADADYGVIGCGKNQVVLYKKQTPVRRNIPQHKAADALVQLIKENKDWKEEEE